MKSGQLFAIVSLFALAVACSQDQNSSDLTDRGGGNRGNGHNARIDADRGTAAWFLTESSEQVLRHAQINGTTEANSIAVQISLQTAQVALSSAQGAVTTPCSMFQESSRLGTVTKWEVACGDSLIENRDALSRGTDLWLLADGLEHSVRQWIGCYQRNRSCQQQTRLAHPLPRDRDI